MSRAKKKMYRVVCLVDEVIVMKREMMGEYAQDVVRQIQDDLPIMRSNAARIYLNGFTVSRYAMGQTIYH